MMANNFQPKHVAFLLPVYNVVFIDCNIHLCLIRRNGHVSFQSRLNSLSFLYRKRDTSLCPYSNEDRMQICGHVIYRTITTVYIFIGRSQ
jgi:hypothetical protein